MKTRQKELLRWLTFAVGLCINSFGICFVTKSALGTSQISSIPYVLSLRLPALSFGACTFAFNLLLILGQFLILKKDFRPIQLLQLPATLLFSGMIDLSMGALSFFQPEALLLRTGSLLLGCLILAFGICVEVAPQLIMVPGEGMVNALTRVTSAKFGTVKICFDVTLIAIAGLISVLLFGHLNGVGLGTLVSALTVGKFVNLLNRVPFVAGLKQLSVASQGVDGV